MKSFVAIILILGMMGLFAGMVVEGGTTATVTARVTPGQISVAVAPSTYSYGIMAINATASSTRATSTNDGGLTENFDIQGSNAATSTYLWDISTTTLGTDRYMHAYTTDSTEQSGTATGTNAATGWVPLDKGGTYNTLATNVTQNSTQAFWLDMRTPSAAGASTTYNQVYETTVTVRASTP